MKTRKVELTRCYWCDKPKESSDCKMGHSFEAIIDGSCSVETKKFFLKRTKRIIWDNAGTVV